MKIPTTETIRTQLESDLEIIRQCEKRCQHLLSNMNYADPLDDLTDITKGLSYNKRLAHIHYERVKAVFEVFGLDTEEMPRDADTLATTIDQL